MGSRRSAGVGAEGGGTVREAALRGLALRSLTVTVLGVAAAWTLLELLASASVDVFAIAILGPIWAAGVIVGVAARKGDRVAWERSSSILLGTVFFANRLAFLGVDVLAMSAFLALLLFLAVVHRFNRAFGDVYRTIQGDTPLLREVDRALTLGLARALGAIGIALALTLVVANVISLGLAPFTSPLTALILTLLFILILLRLVRSPPASREPSR